MTTRADVKAYLVEAFAPRLAALATESQPVEVDDGWPGKKLQRNHVWCDRVTGTWTFPFIEAGDKTRDDRFTVKLICQASGPADSIAECDARSESYAEAFALMIAQDPSLNSMDGLVAAWFEDDAVEGPMGEFTDEGAWSMTTAELNIHLRT